MYLLSTQLAQSSPSQASFNINTMYFIIIVSAVHCGAQGLLCMRNDLPLGKGKSPLVWAIISGKTPPKPRVLPAWGEWGKSLVGALYLFVTSMGNKSNGR